MTIIEFLKARIAEDEANAGSWYESWKDTMDSMEDRVLAECAAKRHLIELHHTAVQQVEMAGPGPAAPILTAVAGTYAATLRVLASTYADHPDYREEWKP